MDDTLKSKILELLNQHRLMTVATNRPDGWPQATTVGYVNDGLTILGGVFHKGTRCAARCHDAHCPRS